MERSYLLISCEIGFENEIFSQLKKIVGIKKATITYGDYDIVVEAETEDAKKMDELVTSKIRKMDKIRSTITLRVTN